MSPAATVKTADVSAWVKWTVGILISVLVAVNGWAFAYTIGIEHRVTTVETAQATHERKAKEDKQMILQRMDQQEKKQDENQALVIASINKVAVDVARLCGYMERSKP